MWHEVTMRLILVVMLLAGLVITAYTPTAIGQETARTFIGRVVGGEARDALVAVVVAPDNTAIAYLCSADDAWNRQNSKWFTGEMTPQGQLTARANDGTELSARAVGDQLDGMVGTLRWTADLAEAPAGLYRGRAGDTIHAVIQAADGTRVGRAWTVVTGAHQSTWNFNEATVVWQPGMLSAQRNQPEFIFVELPVCLNAFCGD
jgi:hypothetical protein